jgi:hypothetical protein
MNGELISDDTGSADQRPKEVNLNGEPGIRYGKAYKRIPGLGFFMPGPGKMERQTPQFEPQSTFIYGCDPIGFYCDRRIDYVYALPTHAATILEIHSSNKAILGAP